MTLPITPFVLRARTSQLNRVAVHPGQTKRERIYGLVYRQMVSLVGRSEELDDLVQIAAEQAIRSLDRFDGRSELATWTYRICHNVMLKQRRWYHRWFKRFAFWESSEPIEVADCRLNRSQTLDLDERAVRLWAAIERITPKRRVVVVLHDLEGIAVEDIAHIVGCNPLTVRSRLRDGRKMLAEALRSDPYFGLPACQTESE